MVQKHRISTNIGKDQLVKVELKQDFDLLEILSLKFTQQQTYSSLCADYGVVCGRVSVNNGFGVPNAKVSIFVPINDVDVNDPVISTLYPYKQTGDKNENNYRYNLLPARKQHGGHTPTGTFPDQEDVLTREEVLEVYESYYSYTVKTNDAGDFMIWGVPLGSQTIHVDLDLSDIGCFSLRPYDFIKKGVGVDKFERYYSFKGQSDIDGLPQIVSFTKTLQVYPFWGNEDYCEIGLTRTDFDLADKDIKIEPISLILLSSVTDGNIASVKRNGFINPHVGYKCNLQTSEGKIECVRYTGKKVIGSDNVTLYPELEYYNITETIDQDGVSMVPIPMNMEYVFTNEFGEQEITNDTNKGIPTTTVARFRIGLEAKSTAKYLIPQIREYNKNADGSNNLGEYDEELLTTYQFSNVFEDYLNIIPPSDVTLGTNMSTGFTADKKALMLGTNNGGVPEDVFYKFIFGKVYTVSSFQGSHQYGSYNDAFLGLKQIRPNAEEDCESKTNHIPTNFAYKNRTKINLLISEILLFIQYIFAVITITVNELVGRFLLSIGKALYGIYFGSPFNWRPFDTIGERFQDSAYRIQVNGTQILPLTIYPDCTVCSLDSEYTANNQTTELKYASVGEVLCKIVGIGEGSFAGGKVVLIPISGNTSTNDNSSWLTSYYSNAKAREYDINDPYLSGNTFNFDLSDATQIQRNDILLALTVPGVRNNNQVTVVPEQGDNNDSRFIADVFPILYDNVLPYSAATGDYSGRTTSDGFTNFILNFNAANTALSNKSYFQQYVPQHHPGISFDNPFNDLRPNWGAWQSADTGYQTTIQNWVNYAGIWETYTTAIAVDHPTWSNLSGLNYDTYNHDEPYIGSNNGQGNIADRGTYAIIRVYDRNIKKSNPSGDTSTLLTIEQGCEKYDKAYNETNSLKYLWAAEGITYGDRYNPINPDTYYPADLLGYPLGYKESQTDPNNGTTITGYTIMADIIGSAGAERSPRYKRWGKIGSTYYDRQTKSGYSEIRDGVFTVIPVINGGSKNVRMILEWYRRKRVGLFFCGGVVNYSFVDNWLNGLLYFFKFDNKIIWDDEAVYDLGQRVSKFPRNVVFYNVFDKNFYYRSTPYNPTNGFIGRQTTNLGSSYYEILHPTTFYDVGVRDEFLYEICTDPRVDPTTSVIRDITKTSYQDPAKIVEYAINYRLDINNGKFDVDDFFTDQDFGGVKTFDGDIVQLMSINCEAGIEAFDTDSPQYFLYNGEFMDPENPYFESYFLSNGSYSPTPIDLKFSNIGAFIRGCLNLRLGDYTQKVPFYLWNKGGTGFGSYGNNSDQQRWDRNKIAVAPLQRIFSISGVTNSLIGETITNYLVQDGNEEYLLKPMTITHPEYAFTGNSLNMLERFKYIGVDVPPTGATQAVGAIEGEMWLHVTLASDPTQPFKDPLTGDIYVVVNQTWVKQPDGYIKDYQEMFITQTALNYAGVKQVLSTPYLFYFGLRPDKTSLDLLIKYFGPKGAFPPVE